MVAYDEARGSMSRMKRGLGQHLGDVEYVFWGAVLDLQLFMLMK